MKKIFYVIILNLFLCTAIGAQERFFEFVPGWMNMHIEETDSGYLSLGLGEIDGGSGTDHTFITSRINEFGETLNYTETILDTANVISLRTRKDNVISIGNEKIVVGMKAYAEYQTYGLLVWYNEDMSEVNNFRSYDLGWNARFSTINHPNDSTLIVGGYVSTNNNPVWTDPVLINMDLDGNIRWQVNYHCGDNCRGYLKQVLETDDGGYLIVTEQQEYVDVFVRGLYSKYTKVNNDGVVEWTYEPGDKENYKYYSAGAVQLYDGNILIAYSDAMIYDSVNWQWNEDNTHIYYEKLDISTGLLFSTQTFYSNEPGAKKVINMLKSSEGDIIISAWWGAYIAIFKLTTDGDLIWVRKHILYPGTWQNVPFGLIETIDGGFMLCGELFAGAGKDLIISAYVFKTDEYGCLEPGCQLTDNIDEMDDFNDSQLKVFPNPSSGNFTIYLPERNKGEITVMDVTGKIVLIKDVRNEQAIPIEITQYVSGLYFIQFASEEGEVYLVKIIKN